MTITIERAHHWLNKFLPDEAKTFMGPTVLNLSEEMYKALENNDLIKAWKLIERLPKISSGFGVSNEMAEALVSCACAVCRLGNMEKASELLEDAIGLYYISRHHEGIVRWMLGCVLWQLPGRECKAIETWRNSIRVFETIFRFDHFAAKDKIDWYEKRVKEMREELMIAIDNRSERVLWVKPVVDLPDAEDDASGSESEFVKGLHPSNGDNLPDLVKLTPLKEGEVVWQTEDMRKEFLYLGKIRAGDFDHRGIEDMCDGIVLFQREIDKGYLCFSLTEDREIKISESSKYFMLKVQGHSMNNVDIDENDIVLVHYQKYADNNDFVVAEIVEIDELATLKRFVRRGEKITLKPESMATGYQTHAFSRTSERFYVRGKAVAVFKSKTLFLDKFKLRTPDEKKQYSNLRKITANVAKRDPQIAWRLILIESKRKPDENLLDWIKVAIYRAQRKL